MLLTNDGGLARVLELPATGWVRRYRVRAKGETDQGALDRLRQGVTVDGVAYAEIEATLDRAQGANSWLTMALREGKNREIKRVLEHLGLEVNRLIRLSFGPFQLGEIAEGELEEVKTRVLRDQLGPALAEAAHVDFAGPAAEAEQAPAARRPSPAGERPAAAAQRQERPRESSRREAPVFPAREPPRKKPAPGPRKHISALRTEIAEQGGARKRTLRSETADRSGRTVPVERLVLARGKPKERRQDARGDPASEPQRAPLRGRAQAARRRGEQAPVRGRSAGGARSAGRRVRPARRPRGTPTRAAEAAAARQQRPRGPYDPAKDRSRPDARHGKGPPQRLDERAPKRAGAPGDTGERGPKRFGARPANPGGAKSAGPRGFSGKRLFRQAAFSGKDSRAGPASGYRGKDKGPGGAGRPGGKPSGPRGGPRGGKSGKPGGGPAGGPGKGRPRGKR